MYYLHPELFKVGAAEVSVWETFTFPSLPSMPVMVTTKPGSMRTNIFRCMEGRWVEQWTRIVGKRVTGLISHLMYIVSILNLSTRINKSDISYLKNQLGVKHSSATGQAKLTAVVIGCLFHPV